MPEYQDQFESLLNRVDLSEEHAISLFIGGLQQEIRMVSKMFKPRTLSDAYSLARLQEATRATVVKRNAPLLVTPRPVPTYTKPTSSAPRTIPQLTLPTNVASTSKPATNGVPKMQISQKDF